MNRRVISMILRKKFNGFAETINDAKVRAMVEKNTIITGGSIVSMLLKEKVNDYDLYFTNYETAEAVANYYAEEYNKLNKTNVKVKSDGESVSFNVRVTGLVGEKEESKDTSEKKAKYRPVFFTDNAITLSDGIQIIIRFFGDPDKIHENYDFVHCTSYWTSAPQPLVLRPAALESILTKQLYYIGSKYPICSVIRMRKFINRGWHINAGQILKMLYQISQLDLNNLSVLKEQLVGVDTAYFIKLIEELQKKQEEDPNFQINQTYLASAIDYIFG